MHNPGRKEMKIFVTYGLVKGLSNTTNTRNAVIELSKSIYTEDRFTEAIHQIATKEGWPKQQTVIIFFSVETK